MKKIHINKPIKDPEKNQLRNIYVALVNLQTQIDSYTGERLRVLFDFLGITVRNTMIDIKEELVKK